jgi:RNA polymerase sigma-70 factor (ECF subfamily)
MVGPHYPGLVRRLTLILHDHEEAKDVAQETYWRAFRAWQRFEDGDVRAWLHTIGTRLAVNELRRRSVARRLGTAPVNSWEPERDADLWTALGRLRKEHRAALVLNVLDGYTQAEIASILGAPPGTVASWIATAKRELRDAISGEKK